MGQWIDVCSEDDLQPDSGICVLVENRQVAIFYMPKDQGLYAIDNFDPFGKANVLSRGMIGDLNGIPMVASPLYKQHYNLTTGVCLEDNTVTVKSYPIRRENGRVEISIAE